MLDEAYLDSAIQSLPGYDPYATSRIDEYRFDPVKAGRAIQFIETGLHHVKGAKARRKELFVLERWQRGMVANIFGWVRRDNGLRRYRKVWCFVPRKNGKTPLAACLILTVAAMDGEAGAEIYSAAFKYDQACKVFEHVRGMVKAEPELSRRFKIYGGQAKALTWEDGNSAYRPISSDNLGSHGQNTSCYVVDEVHVFKDGELIEVLDTSVASRDQPLAIYITTSDYSHEGSICNEMHDRFCKIRDGVIDDPKALPVIYEATVDDDWTSEDVWARANPNLGVSVQIEHLRQKCFEAQDSLRLQNSFKRLHLNIRTEQDVAWLPMDRWNECADPAMSLGDYEGQVCWLGLDLSATTDLTALALAFKRDDGGYAVFVDFFLPDDRMHERSTRDGVDYQQWVHDGFITTTPDSLVDLSFIRKRILDYDKRFDVQCVAFDPWQARTFAAMMVDDSVEMVEVRQGHASMGEPTKELEALVISGKLRHTGNPVLRWNAENVVVRLDANANYMPDKKKSVKRIDGVVACIMAIGRGQLAEDTTSVYETRGFVTL